MDDELYPQDEPDEKEEDAPKDKPEAKDKKEDHKDDPTELVSKKFLGIDEDTKAEPGTKCTVEIVHDFGDEVEVRWVKKSKKKKDSDDSDDDDDDRVSADDEIDEIEAGSMKG